MPHHITAKTQQTAPSQITSGHNNSGVQTLSTYAAPTYSGGVMQMAKGKGGKSGSSGKKSGVSRGKFSDDKKEASRLETKISTEKDTIKDAGSKDLSAPHRLPWGAIKHIVLNGDIGDIKTMHDELTTGSKEIEARLNSEGTTESKQLAAKYKKTRERLEKNWASFPKTKTPPPTTSQQQSLIDHFNNLASNAPGYGPHSTVNERVGDLLHINVEGAKGAKNAGTDAPLTPRSRAAVKTIQGVKHKVDIAVNASGKVITPSGELVDFSKVKEISGMGTQQVTRPVDGKTVYDGSHLPKATTTKTAPKGTAKNGSWPSWATWLITIGAFSAVAFRAYLALTQEQNKE